LSAALRREVDACCGRVEDVLREGAQAEDEKKGGEEELR
jgi:hypothetical protein